MRVLILNWRDPKSPRSGGAERVTMDVARGLVERGHDVTWLSSSVEGQPADGWLDGVRVLRRGSEVSTRLYAPAVARRERPDVILEEINTLPYFAPLWTRTPTVLYINQLARDVWWYEAPLPLAIGGWLFEPLYLSAYRNVEVVTISASTRDDLRAAGLRGPVTIAPMTVHLSASSELPMKSLRGSMVAVGRLTPSKRFDAAIHALANLRTTHPEADLTLIGDGRERDGLEALARSLGVEDGVRFLGRASESVKRETLASADVLVGTSVREGWGLTVTEAAMLGTPAVVYDIPGFRDAVIPYRTGYLVPLLPVALADGVRTLISDRDRYVEMQKAARDTASRTSTEALVSSFEEPLLRANAR